MQTLTIFHDPGCGLCHNFHRWLLSQKAYLTIEFVAYDSEEARTRFPLIAELDAGAEIVVLADDGRWWQGPPAWLTCLWALKDYRKFAFLLAAPSLRPMVERTCHLLSENRFKVSQLLRLRPEELGSIVAAYQPSCSTDACAPGNLQRAKLRSRNTTTSPFS
ncbi:thiol-disulfide oxidoreductase DCC family protein [Roseibacillus persicicus]|uniref:DUF393 domain-containing protein n=1 Tax=Roseibacillus persicicus TaxID=454148 RepID=A0A918WLN3_9BACT|nr:DCC1-like thiol-disulfide oxidoreductase family protein [Roseibacillus persicicus]GHC57569.1 hypothetical protein GCM10007100_25680 [Roseibacillus persicicus]